MKVYFDIITNHTADVIGYEEGARTAYVNKDTEPYRTAAGQEFDDRDYAGTNTFPELDPKTSFPYTPVLDENEKDLKVPAWLNDTTLYHNRGNTTFTGEDSQYGDFFGLDDLFTENPEVVDGFIDIYRTWVKDFGVDGFRIDTMKHVDDAFWQKFGPGIVDYAKANGKPEFFMFGEVALDGSTAREELHLALHHPRRHPGDPRLPVPGRRPRLRVEGQRQRGAAHVLRERRLVHRRRLQRLRAADLPRQPRHGPDRPDDRQRQQGRRRRTSGPPATGSPTSSCTSRAATRSSTTATSRASPAPRAATRTPGRRCSPARSPTTSTTTCSAPTRTHAQDNFETSHPLYQRISDLADLTAAHPALRDGAHQMRYASDGPGIVAFSRTDRKEQREYVVALNNSEQPQTASLPTYSAGMRFSRVYGEGPATARTDRDAKLTVTVPPLSSVVYRADGRLARSKHAPKVTLAAPAPAPESRGRMHVRADVASSSFNEVTFQVRSGNGRWTSIGTDDTAPYQVFHDTSTLRTGTPLQYRAVVLDNAGHTRPSGVRSTRVPSPSITVSTPADGGTVANIDPVTVKAAVDPERAAQSVRFERRVGSGDWTVLGTDTSSPDYLVQDDVEALPLGTTVSYRAVLIEPGSPDVTSAPVDRRPSRCRSRRIGSVTVAGNLQSEIGCVAADRRTGTPPARPPT